jgi:hypothetical protein
MPLKLNVGVSKKLGLPEYSSIGANCNIELEVDSMLIHTDLDGLHLQIRGAFIVAQQAVNDELARLQSQSAPSRISPETTASVQGQRDGSEGPADVAKGRTNGVPARNGGASRRTGKPATSSQVRAIITIARKQHADLEGLLRDEYSVARPEDLTLAQASQMIDMLKAAASA